MMGRSHALSGVLAVTLAGAYLAVPPGALLVLGMVVPGSSLLPDVDHARSTVSSTYGPLTRGFSKLVGHRQITHSVPGVLVLGTALYGALAVRDGAADQWEPAVRIAAQIASYGFVCLVLILVLAAFIRLGRGLPGAVGRWFRRSWFDDLAPVPFVGSIVIFSDLDLSLVPVAVMAGCVIHMFGDMITKMGLPILWPLSKSKVRLASIKAGGKIERFLIVPLMIIGIAWSAGVIVWPYLVGFWSWFSAWY